MTIIDRLYNKRFSGIYNCGDFNHVSCIFKGHKVGYE